MSSKAATAAAAIKFSPSIAEISTGNLPAAPSAADNAGVFDAVPAGSDVAALVLVRVTLPSAVLAAPAPKGCVAVGEGGTVELPERVGEGVAVPVLVAAGVTDGETPLVRDAVGDADAAGGVAAPEPACVGVGAPEPVAFAGALPPSKAEPALDGLAPTESNALGRAGAVAPDPASEGDAAGVGVGAVPA